MNLLNTLLIFCFTLCFGAASLNAQNVNIPDANFKAYLVGNAAINTNSDGEIQVTEASAFSGTIDCSSLGITDMTGIEAFTNLIELKCNNNLLINLDVSQNTNLTLLWCYSNQLSSLDVSQNTNLLRLYSHTNQLSSLDVSQNTSLTFLLCHTNQLSSLDVSQNTSLTTLYCYSNQLNNLDVSQNTSLSNLRCYSNQLNNLDVSQNSNLGWLDCSSNQLNNLDVSQNTSLLNLRCYSNQLNNLDVSQNTSLLNLHCYSNQLNNLDVSQNSNLISLTCYSNQLNNLDVKNGNNTGMSLLDARTNPNLTCIQVDDSTYSANNWTSIDPAATFSTNCSVFNKINTINQEINLTAYPNPTTKDITLDFGKLYQEAKIEVTNLTGQIVLNKIVQNNSTANLELEGVAGVYFVNIQTEEGMATLKIIKK